MEEARGDEPIKVFENTYRTEPTDAERFKPSKAVAIMEGVLNNIMAFSEHTDKMGRFTFEFDEEMCQSTAKDISEECHDKVKEMMGEYPRYKLIFQASVSENNGQTLRMASRCLWDKSFDNSATATYTNAKVCAIATCFAFYYE